MKKQPAAIITGGARGLGRAIARHLAAQGKAVLLVARDKKALQATCRAIRRAGGIADYYAGEITDRDSAKQAVAKARGNGWAITNLVCNAGFGKGGAAIQFDPEVWLEQFNVNVHGNFWFIQECLPLLMKERNSCVCIISSTLGISGRKYDAAYAATKAALINLARSLAAEYGKHQVSVVPVCPTFVDTQMTRRCVDSVARHKKITRAEARELIAATNPQDRIIPPDEVARVVAFVCSGQAQSLSGNPIIMSCGAQ